MHGARMVACVSIHKRKEKRREEKEVRERDREREREWKRARGERRREREGESAEFLGITLAELSRSCIRCIACERFLPSLSEANSPPRRRANAPAVVIALGPLVIGGYVINEKRCPETVYLSRLQMRLEGYRFRPGIWSTRRIHRMLRVEPPLRFQMFVLLIFAICTSAYRAPARPNCPRELQQTPTN